MQRKGGVYKAIPATKALPVQLYQQNPVNNAPHCLWQLATQHCNFSLWAWRLSKKHSHNSATAVGRLSRKQGLISNQSLSYHCKSTRPWARMKKAQAASMANTLNKSRCTLCITYHVSVPCYCSLALDWIVQKSEGMNWRCSQLVPDSN